MNPGRNKETTDSIIRGLALPFFAVDNDYKIIFFNEALEKLTGYSEQEVLGKPCHEILRSEDLELVGAVSRTYQNRNLSEVLGTPKVDLRIIGTVQEALNTMADVLIDYTSRFQMDI